MFFQQVVNGIFIGVTYALVTIGFNMVYGVLKLTNFAHSSFYMLAAYFAQFIAAKFMLQSGVSWWLVLVISVGLTATLGASMDILALRPIRKKKGAGITALISTIGVQTMLNNGVLLVFGTVPLVMNDPFNLGYITVGGAVIQNIQILIAVLAICLLAVLSFIVYKTSFGTAMRAVSQNPTAASLMGINVPRIISETFFVGIAAAAFAGVLMATYYQRVDSLMGASVGLKCFAAAVLGGIGSVPGAALGGLLIGLAETIFAGYVSSGYRDMVAFVVLITVLLLRPQGLLGKKEIKKV
ncbi:branched-chain amino acid ABC transporter permease [Amygdalobacter nucleatus]|uniref:Putative high-affinity branched-chain amino acid ABC transporter, permease protein LivH n=1 Tax=Amygdalobacter nucleatus TaxID=3029274 RepID=A0A133YAU8_9FIRM|nr:branched-chain amino acid ABC transporter permease [Amygdalobacter nucleatus]KXB40338.1 putative high-affinity branched-chain amino acid ABC transporter, permease protein LivH [Amygdalobacter nucleatus]MDF0486344.1 branched-chain amino acid ABC transporter permease [Amygdalobacter nucleatus]